MRNTTSKYSLRFINLFIAAMFAAFGVAHAQTTNWIAFNDHRPGPIIPPHVPTATAWGTAQRVTGYDMGAPSDTVGAVLTNFLTGDSLPVTMNVTRTGSPDNFGSITGPGTNTPAGNVFFRKCDLSNSGIVGVDAGLEAGGTVDFVTFTFNNLNPSKRYLFRGTSCRGGGYALRWSVAQILAQDFIDAHVAGVGSPGVLTSNDYPAYLHAGQAAWNSGDNVEGDVVGWDFISPYANGSVSLVVSQYVGMTPVGLATDLNYGYSFGAIMLAEIEATTPTITAQPQAQTTVEENRPFSLTVGATGSPLLYQWYKQGVGAISGATFPTYSVSRAALGDAGNYYAVVYNPLARKTSDVAHVTVNIDNTPPFPDTVFSYPTYDTNSGVSALNRVIIDFNESIDASTAGSPSQYTVSSVGNPSSVTVTGERTVLLTLGSLLSQDADYTVTITGVKDLAGNTISGGPRPFHTWMQFAGNGLQFDAYNTGSGVDVSVLTGSPNYPNNPYLRTNLWAFDTRVVYPDNSHELYGARVRGAFIPPVSGNWLFYFRTYQRGDVYLNPDGSDEAGKVLILRESTGNEPRNWNKFISAPIPLRAGRPYYIEGLYQSDTGNDVIKVAARLLGTPSPSPNDTSVNDLDTNSLYGAEIAGPLAPRDLGGPLTIAQGPANLTIPENHVATFSVNLNNPSGLPVRYSWYRNNVLLTTNAAGSSYSFTATTNDSGAVFRVEASKIGSFVASGNATLTVQPDHTPPHALYVFSGATSLSEIVVHYDELVTSGTASDTFNYGIANGPETAALLPDGQSARITLTTPLIAGQTYELAISGILDLSGNILEDTNLTFVAASDALLAIEVVDDYVNISWPASASTLGLEETSDLASGAWTPVPVPPNVGNGRAVVSLFIENGNRFFRLKQ